MGNNNDLLSVDSDAIVHQDLLDVLEQFRVVFATSHEAFWWDMIDHLSW
jgi:hypothetical protein